MPADVDPNATFSPTIGFLYVFNLIVGTGALALPAAFQTAGWALSIVLLCISALVSYVSATFVLEALSVANAVTRKQRKEGDTVDYGDVSVATDNGPSSFEITQRVEVSQMASMFLGRAGVIFSYLALNVYLFGDLAIYSTTVPKSFMNIICSSVNETTLPNDPCQPYFPAFLDRFTVYRLSVVLFIFVCLPMVLIGITKTKYLQLATTVSRWTAFSLMIFLASIQLMSDGPAASPPPVNIHGFGSLFGVTVYAFMCHHSLPGLITPMSHKLGVMVRLMGVYTVVLAFYFTLSLTGAFTFAKVQDVYTLNFLHDGFTSIPAWISDHFLALFPVFTLTTNYPIVATTLINNVKVLKKMVMPQQALQEEESLLDNQDPDDESLRMRSSRSPLRPANTEDLVIPLLVLGLPTIISLLTDDVMLLASVTGSYPGVGVQFLIPCFLVIKARQHAKSVLNFPVPKKHSSPFVSPLWPLAIFAWSAFAIVMVTLNMFKFTF